MRGYLLNKQIRGCFRYRQWRSDVFERDEYTCQDCGQKGGKLHAHHSPKELHILIEEYKIDSVDKAINCEEAWSMNNGITLCLDCHDKRHGRKWKFSRVLDGQDKRDKN